MRRAADHGAVHSRGTPDRAVCGETAICQIRVLPARDPAVRNHRDAVAGICQRRGTAVFFLIIDLSLEIRRLERDADPHRADRNEQGYAGRRKNRRCGTAPDHMARDSTEHCADLVLHVHPLGGQLPENFSGIVPAVHKLPGRERVYAPELPEQPLPEAELSEYLHGGDFLCGDRLYRRRGCFRC